MAKANCPLIPGSGSLMRLSSIVTIAKAGFHHTRYQSNHHVIAPLTLRFAEQMNSSCTIHPRLDPGSNSGKAIIICFFTSVMTRSEYLAL